MTKTITINCIPLLLFVLVAILEGKPIVNGLPHLMIAIMPLLTIVSFSKLRFITNNILFFTIVAKLINLMILFSFSLLLLCNIFYIKDCIDVVLYLLFISLVVASLLNVRLLKSSFGTASIVGFFKPLKWLSGITIMSSIVFISLRENTHFFAELLFPVGGRSRYPNDLIYVYFQAESLNKINKLFSVLLIVVIILWAILIYYAFWQGKKAIKIDSHC